MEGKTWKGSLQTSLLITLCYLNLLILGLLYSEHDIFIYHNSLNYKFLSVITLEDGANLKISEYQQEI